MRRVLIVLGVVILFDLAVLGAIFLPDEMVTLRTTDEAGEVHKTPLWIGDEGDVVWLFATLPESEWLERLKARPEISVERGDALLEFTAVVVPGDQTRARIDALFREKYGMRLFPADCPRSR